MLFRLVDFPETDQERGIRRVEGVAAQNGGDLGFDDLGPLVLTQDVKKILQCIQVAVRAEAPLEEIRQLRVVTGAAADFDQQFVAFMRAVGVALRILRQPAAGRFHVAAFEVDARNVDDRGGG